MLVPSSAEKVFRSGEPLVKESFQPPRTSPMVADLLLLDLPDDELQDAIIEAKSITTTMQLINFLSPETLTKLLANDCTRNRGWRHLCHRKFREMTDIGRAAEVR